MPFPHNWVEELTDDVKLIGLPDLIEDIVETVREWKRHLPRGTKSAAGLTMFSRTSWLLQVIDCLERNRMLKLLDHCAGSSHLFLILRPYARCSKPNSHSLVRLSACEKGPVPRQQALSSGTPEAQINRSSTISAHLDLLKIVIGKKEMDESYRLKIKRFL